MKSFSNIIIIFSFLLLVSVVPESKVVGARCTRTNQCGYNEVCLITEKNSWSGTCVKIYK